MLNRKIKILVVDDSATTRKIAIKYLTEAGFKPADEAEDGYAAWTKIATSAPAYDLVICDWHMPKISGFDLLNKIRANARFGNIPFIMVTGERNHEEVLKAVEAGVSGYIVKPFEAETLLKAMEKITLLNAKPDSDKEKLGLHTKRGQDSGKQ